MSSIAGPSHLTESYDVTMRDASSPPPSHASPDDMTTALTSSFAEQESDTSRSRSQKRKHPDESNKSTHAKRFKSLYSAGYHELYNDTVLKIASRDKGGDINGLRQIQLGVTKWAPSEQATFFETLTRKGCDDLPGLNAAIKTKSEPEIRDYLLQLRDASTHQQVYEPLDSLLDQSELPAAYEISPQCEAALEDAADALGALQQGEDYKAEKRRYGSSWRLTRPRAQEVDKNINDHLDPEVVGVESFPAAALLNPKNFLNLMETFFMNSVSPEYNYRTHTQLSNEKPSILHTAFSDFHTLVVSLTRRLIHTALFLASSRLRTLENPKKVQKKLVKRKDVTAALEILNLQTNTHDYWVGLARRVKLNVYEEDYPDPTTLAFAREPLDYNVVENALNQGRRETGHYANTPLEILPPSAIPTPTDETKHSPPPSDSASEYLSSGASSNASTDLSTDYRPSDRSRIQRYQTQAEDAYISALDDEASLREELRLWHVLGKEPPEDILPYEIDIPEKPVFEPKPLGDIDDWRKRTAYAAEWEVLEAPIPGRNVERNDSTKRSRSNQVPKRQGDGDVIRSPSRLQSASSESRSEDEGVYTSKNASNTSDNEDEEQETPPHDILSALESSLTLHPQSQHHHKNSVSPESDISSRGVRNEVIESGDRDASDASREDYWGSEPSESSDGSLYAAQGGR